ncbi:MAG TPA: hypothetical protein VMG32_01415 [Anaeromyxobacteraceae bacterium]|nr:hypothetical protein [Anaeromyxobacteraceae bacterium]
MTLPSPDRPEKRESAPKPRRQLRNYLLDPGLQLRFGGYLLAVAVLLSAVLGYHVWRAYRTASRLVALGDPRPDAVVASLLASEDRARLVFMCGALFALALVLLALSVVVTHRIAGPAFALGRTCREVGRGALAPPRPLRKSDLLVGLSEEVAAMVAALRAREAGERDRLAEAAGLLEEAPERARELILELSREKERRLRP